MIELLQCDCMDYMATLPDKSVGLAIVDPPYGDTVKQGGYMSNQMGNKSHQKAYNCALWKQSRPDKKYFDELIRVSKNQIIWGANHFMSLIPFDSSCWIAWDKKRDAQDWADIELAWTSFDSVAKIFRFAWDGFRQGDMKNKEARIHPTQKPVALYKWLLKNYAKPGDKILDTHGGSMSIAIACNDMGFDLTLCELDPDYYATGKARYENHIRQGKLFDAKDGLSC